MFECPRCGFKDAPCWRTSRFVIYAVYCTLDELSVWEPELAEKLKSEKRVDHGPYIYYRRGRQNHIYRIHRELVDFTKAGKTEKYRIPPKANKRLTDYTKEEEKQRR